MARLNEHEVGQLMRMKLSFHRFNVLGQEVFYFPERLPALILLILKLQANAQHTDHPFLALRSSWIKGAVAVLRAQQEE